MLSDPINILVLFLFWAALTAFSLEDRKVKVARLALAMIAFLFLLTAIFPVGQWILSPLENKFVTMLPSQVDGIVLLTGDEDPVTSQARGLPVGGHATQRYVSAARLLKQYPKAKLVVVGTTAPDSPRSKYSTQAISSQFLRDLEIPSSRIVYETDSRNTRENAVLSQKIIKPHKKEKWLLLTSAYHLPRSVLCFEKVGWKTVPVAADYFTDGRVSLVPTFNFIHQLRLIRAATHEYIGLVSYWLLGWVDRPW